MSPLNKVIITHIRDHIEYVILSIFIIRSDPDLGNLVHYVINIVIERILIFIRDLIFLSQLSAQFILKNTIT